MIARLLVIMLAAGAILPAAHAATVGITVTGPSQKLTVTTQSTVITPETVTVNAVIDAQGVNVVTVAVPGPQGIPGTGEGGGVTVHNNLSGRDAAAAHPANTIIGLAGVATSGSYADLSNTPTIPDSANQIAYAAGISVADALDQLLYVAPDVSGIGNNHGTLEVGTPITSTQITWSLNKTMTGQTITRPTDGIVSIGANDTGYTHSRAYAPTSQTTNTYTVTASDNDNSDSASTSVNWYWKRYWGVSPAASVDDAAILAMSGDLATSHGRTVTYDCTGGRYPYFVYPASWGLLTAVTVGGLSFTDFSTATQQHVNSQGVAGSYYVVRFNQLQTGAAITVVWH